MSFTRPTWTTTNERDRAHLDRRRELHRRPVRRAQGQGRRRQRRRRRTTTTTRSSNMADNKYGRVFTRSTCEKILEWAGGRTPALTADIDCRWHRSQPWTRRTCASSSSRTSRCSSSVAVTSGLPVRSCTTAITRPGRAGQPHRGHQRGVPRLQHLPAGAPWQDEGAGLGMGETWKEHMARMQQHVRASPQLHQQPG